MSRNSSPPGGDTPGEPTGWSAEFSLSYTFYKEASMCIPELMSLARKHWEKWLPEKVRDLRAEGKLDEALHGAASLAQAEIDHLTRRCGYQEHEAREVALPLFILLKPEPTDDDDELEEELREKKRQYQMNLPAEVYTP
jgi:hypothetical protein